MTVEFALSIHFGVALAALLIVWRYRDGFLLPVVAMALACLPPLAVSLFGGRFDSRMFEGMVYYALISVGVFAFAWGITVLMRKTQNKDRAWLPWLTGIPFALVLGFLGLKSWSEGDFGLAVKNLPVVKSEKQLLELWKKPYSERIFHVLSVGKMGKGKPNREHVKNGLADILWYDARKSGGVHMVRFRLTMAEGGVVEVDTPLSIHAAWNWPQSKRGHSRHSLAHGDPVVVWAEIGRSKSVSGKQGGRLHAPRMIAYGSLEDFLKNYGKTGQLQGQMYLALARTVFAAALILLIFSWLAMRHIRKHGSDEKSAKITIS